jgi:hypothetical protein
MEVLEKNVRALVRMSAVLTSLSERLDALEHRREPARSEEDEPADFAPLATSPLALRCDGRLLLSTADLEGVDLSGRELFTGIVLSEAEACDVLDRLADIFDEAAAYSAARILKGSKKPTSDGEEGGADE